MDEQRLRRVFDVLEYVAQHGSVTATEVSRALDLPVSSSHDLLKAMAQIDAVSQDRKSYMLGPLALRFSFSVADGVSVTDIAQPHLEELARDSQLDTYLAVRLGRNIVYSSRYEGAAPLNLDIPLGRSLYLHATAVGKLFAAMDRQMYQALVAAPRPRLTERTRVNMDHLIRDLRGIRAHGVSISQGESIPGIIGVASPVRDHLGRLIAATHVSMRQVSASADCLRQVCAMVDHAAQSIARDLAAAAEPKHDPIHGDQAPSAGGGPEVGQRQGLLTIRRSTTRYAHA